MTRNHHARNHGNIRRNTKVSELILWPVPRPAG
jgi:hypothetical protein